MSSDVQISWQMSFLMRDTSDVICDVQCYFQCHSNVMTDLTFDGVSDIIYNVLTMSFSM